MTTATGLLLETAEKDPLNRVVPGSVPDTSSVSGIGPVDMKEHHMCKSKAEGGRRCAGIECWHVNAESHDRFLPDTEQERHWMRPVALLSMAASAIKVRRSRAKKKAAEVEAMRTVNGIAAHAPIGPVLRAELWEHRYQGAGLSMLILADRFRAVAADEGISVEEVADQYREQQVMPYRQRAGQRLADLVITEDRPDWVDPDRLVRMIEPLENGTPSPVYLVVVKDNDDSETEYVMVSSYDGSEPMAWPHTPAGIKAAAQEALARMAVAHGTDEYAAWAEANDASETPNPWTQGMASEAEVFASGSMHLIDR